MMKQKKKFTKKKNPKSEIYIIGNHNLFNNIYFWFNFSFRNFFEKKNVYKFFFSARCQAKNAHTSDANRSLALTFAPTM